MMSDESQFESRVRSELAQVRETKESIKAVAKLVLGRPHRLAVAFHAIADAMPQTPIKERMVLLYVFDAICQRAKQSGLEYARVAAEYAPPICLGVVHEDGVAHKLASGYVKSVRKVLDIWSAKGIFDREMVAMLSEEVKRGGDVMQEGTELLSSSEARRLQEEAEQLRRKQKEEKLESQLRPVVGDAAAEFDELWALGGENLHAGGMAKIVPAAPEVPEVPASVPAAAIAAVPEVKAEGKRKRNKNDQKKAAREKKESIAAQQGEKKRERSRERSPNRRANAPAEKTESKKAKRSGASGTILLLELHDGLLPWQALRSEAYGAMLGRGERRSRSELERDGKWLWEGLNRLLDLIAEEELLYHVLRRVEPPNVLFLDPHMRSRQGDFRRSDREMRAGDKGLAARFEHVMYAMDHLKSSLGPSRWEEVVRLRRDADRDLNGALSRADDVLRVAKNKGMRVVVVGEEGLISTLALVALLGLAVDPRDVWTAKGRGREELLIKLKSWRHEGKRIVGLVRTPRDYKGLLDEMLTHPLAQKVSLDKVVEELSK